MAINKEMQKAITTIIDKETFEKYKQLCADKKRSISKQTGYLIEYFIENASKRKEI